MFYHSYFLWGNWKLLNFLPFSEARRLAQKKFNDAKAVIAAQEKCSLQWDVAPRGSGWNYFKSIKSNLISICRLREEGIEGCQQRKRNYSCQEERKYLFKLHSTYRIKTKYVVDVWGPNEISKNFIGFLSWWTFSVFLCFTRCWWNVLTYN